MSDIHLANRDKNGRASLHLESLLLKGKPKAVGMATAFLSVDGAKIYQRLVRAPKTTSHVVVGLSGAITHPNAIDSLAQSGHNVKIGTFTGGIFHPKLLVGGDHFRTSGDINAASCGYVGSANITGGGLERNLEIMLATCDQEIATQVSAAFSTIWGAATPLTPVLLENYRKTFARAQRKRSLADLEFLEIVEPDSHEAGRRHRLILPKDCSAVWAGLQSFTGEHTFQVEFPRLAGEALGTLLGTDEGEVEIDCADGQARTMKFKYYVKNGMYRLNVPNGVPLVEWARAHHDGALLVWQDDAGTTGRLNAEIIRGRRLKESVARSTALGTKGKTTTREYGWY